MQRVRKEPPNGLPGRVERVTGAIEGKYDDEEQDCKVGQFLFYHHFAQQKFLGRMAVRQLAGRNGCTAYNSSLSLLLPDEAVINY